MGTSAVVIPRTYRAHKWSTGQIRPWPQPPGLWLPAGHFEPQLQPMRAVFPRPDSETSAAAPHHWAYWDGTTGIEYRKTLAPSFGSPPWVFVLVSGPPGMQFGSTSWDTAWRSGAQAFINGYGRIFWTPDRVVTSYPVVARAYDQNGNWVEFTWTVSTSSSTAQFVFVDNVNGLSTNPGTLSAPYDSLATACGSTYSAVTNPDAIVYLRNPSGTAPKYAVPGYTDNTFVTNTPSFQLQTAQKPIAVLGYPGENPILDMSTLAGAIFSGNDETLQDVRCDGYLSTTGDMRLVWVSADRCNIEGVSWTNSGYGSSGGDNATGIFVSATNGNGNQYLSISGYVETNRQAGYPGNNYSGISIYSMLDCAVQYGELYSPNSNVDSGWYFKGSGTRNGWMFALKSHFAAAIHEFSIGQSTSATSATLYVSNNHITHCLSLTPTASIDWPNTGNSSWNWGPNRLSRTSMVGGGIISNQSAPTPGPFSFDSNALQTSTALPTGTNITNDGKNLLVPSGMLDLTTGDFTASYLSGNPGALGTVGAQIA